MEPHGATIANCPADATEVDAENAKKAAMTIATLFKKTLRPSLRRHYLAAYLENVFTMAGGKPEDHTPYKLWGLSETISSALTFLERCVLAG